MYTSENLFLLMLLVFYITGAFFLRHDMECLIHLQPFTAFISFVKVAMASSSSEGLPKYERLVILTCLFQEAVIAIDNLDDFISENPDLQAMGQGLQNVLNTMHTMSDLAHTQKNIMGDKLKKALEATQESSDVLSPAESSTSMDAGLSQNHVCDEPYRPYREGCINDFEDLQVAWRRHEG